MDSDNIEEVACVIQTLRELFFPAFACVCSCTRVRVCVNRAHDAQPVCAKCDLGVK